jgi:hypothetical protein
MVWRLAELELERRGNESKAGHMLAWHGHKRAWSTTSFITAVPKVDEFAPCYDLLGRIKADSLT